MQLEDLLKAMLRSFCVITTGIVASMFMFCLIFYPDATFSLADIGKVILMGLISDSLFIIFYSPKELDKKQMLIRNIIHLLALLFTLIYFANLWNWIELSNFKEVMVLAILIMSVYIIVYAINTYKDKKMADKLYNCSHSMP